MHKIAMRRLAIIYRELPINAGGGHGFVETVVHAIQEATPNEKVEVLLVRQGRSKFSRNFLANRKRSSIHEISVPGVLRRSLLRLFSTSSSLQRRILATSPLENFIKRRAIDFVFFLGPFATQTSVPFGMLIWDLQHRTHPWFPEFSNNGVWEKRERFYKKLLPRASVVITGTEAGREQIISFYGVDRANIYLIPHPLPKGFLPFLDREQPKKSGLNTRPTILYPAQFWPHKNHSTLIEALYILKSSSKIIPKLILVGDDKGNRKYIETRINNLCLVDDVEILGFVTHEELLALYSRSDALVYASFSGPENLPPLEAMAVGIPVIYPTMAGAKEQLGDLPVYFDPQSATSLANAISQVIINDDRFKAQVELGRKLVQERLPEVFARELLNVLEKFMAYRNAWR